MAEQEQQPTNEILITRRVALATLATFSTSLLGRMQAGSLTPLLLEEFLAPSTLSMTTCWYLLQGRAFGVIRQVLTPALPLLRSLGTTPSAYQTSSAYLASQGCLIMGLLALHNLPVPHNLHQRLRYCTQATELATLSNDPELRVIALTHLANTYFDLGQHQNMLSIYQKAASILEKESVYHHFPSLLQSKLHIELAHAYVQHGQVAEALYSLGEAQTAFLKKDEAVPIFLSTDYGFHSLMLFEGLIYLDIAAIRPGKNHIQQAVESLARIEQGTNNPPTPERFRVEITNLQALAAVKEGNREQFCHYLMRGVEGARSLQSEKRRQEALANWQAAREQWPQEQAILELADLFV